MAETKIWVRKIYQDPKEFHGKKYTEYKLYSTEALYYTSSKPFDPAIEEGSDVLLEAEPTKNPKYFKIKQIKAFNLNKLNAPPVVKTQAAQAPSTTPSPAGQLPILSPKLQAEWLRLATEAMDRYYGKDWDIMALAPVLAELVHRHYGDYVAAQQKQRWGK